MKLINGIFHESVDFSDCYRVETDVPGAYLVTRRLPGPRTAPHYIHSGNSPDIHFYGYLNDVPFIKST